MMAPDRDEGCSLPRDAYTSDSLYATEIDRVWRAGWLFAGFTCELAEPGDYITLNVDSDPILILRDDDGKYRAFHNICTHRGTILCAEERGRLGKVIVCPYHQWTFARDGGLKSCRGMHADLDRSGLNLRPVACETVAGMVFVSLACSPPSFDPLRETLSAAEPHGFDRARVAERIDYTIASNWKLVWENNRECYHCDAGHPQYVKANFDIFEGERDTPAVRAELASAVARAEKRWKETGLSITLKQSGLARFPNPDENWPVSATRTVMVDGYETESIDGRRVAPLMGRLPGPESGVLRLRGLPNFWCHASCDHAVLTRLLPAGRTTTLATVYWLLDGAAEVERDSMRERLLPFWQLTSEQDWKLCELAQRGVSSSAYRPGPLSRDREYNVDAFLSWYMRRVTS